MTWTYNGDPAASDLEAVRFLIQDTNSSNQLFQDAELEWLIDQEMNVYMAAAAAVDILIRKISGGGANHVAIGDFEIGFPGVEEWKMLGSDLRRRGLNYQEVFAGGISESEKNILEEDTDWPPRYFKLGLHQEPTVPETATVPIDEALE